MWRAAVLFLCLLLDWLGVSGAADHMTAHTSPREAYVGKLLVIAQDGSHWVGLKAIAQEMGRRGHQVTVVMPEVSMRIGPGDHYSTLTFPVPYDEALIQSILRANAEVASKSAKPFMERIRRRFSQIQNITGLLHATAESLLFNDSLISHLSQQSFDAVLTNPMVPTGSLIARKLGLPTINLLRGVPCSLDVKSAACPSPPSYVPRFFSGYTDRMNFKQRLVNFLIAAVEPLLCRLLYWHFDYLAYQFLGEHVGIAEVLADSDLWLLRTDFALEFPRPLMPNMVEVGGINCNLRTRLPEDLESWLSGPHGFIVFTLGSMVSELPEEVTAVFLDVFRQIPQQVIWRYTGTTPDNVPENVKMMKWVPQNDLLAHPGARAFITHAGSHGLYEGVCHAVPMVMLPLNGDQPDNARRLESKGAGVVLDIFSITEESLLQGLNDVVKNTSYRESLKKLSALHKDRIMEPLALSVYWIEFVMQHKGAKHLKSTAAHLNWIQYHSLDVLALLLTAVTLVVVVAVRCLKLCMRRVTKRKQD